MPPEPVNLGEYRDRIEEARRLVEQTRRFEEPERVPVVMSVAGSYFCWLLGVDIADYYQDIDLQVDVQLYGARWCFEELQDDRTGYALHYDAGPVAEGLLFGLPIERPRGTSPWIVRGLHTAEQIEGLQVPDPAQAEGVQEHFRRIAQFRARAKERGLDVPVGGGGIGIHPPLSCATAIADAALIYALMLERPDVIHRLFAKLLQAFCACIEYTCRRNGTDLPSSIGLADDNSAFVGLDVWRRLVLPYNLAIYERYGHNGRSLHGDGPNDHIFWDLAHVVRIHEMDIGGFSDIAVAKRDMAGKTVIRGNLNCRDLYGDFAAARPAVDRCLRIGAPGGGFIFGVGGETYAGVNPKTLCEVVAYVKQTTRRPDAVGRRQL